MWNKRILSLLIIALFVALAAGSGSSTSTTADKKAETAAPPVAAVEVTSQQLCADYDANEISADEKYKGKTLKITGTVDNIAKDLTDTMYVTLTSGQPLTRTQCYFDDSAKDQLGKLTKGQALTVEGKCNGKMMNILIKECVIK